MTYWLWVVGGCLLLVGCVALAVVAVTRVFLGWESPAVPLASAALCSLNALVVGSQLYEELA